MISEVISEVIMTSQRREPAAADNSLSLHSLTTDRLQGGLQRVSTHRRAGSNDANWMGKWKNRVFVFVCVCKPVLIG